MNIGFLTANITAPLEKKLNFAKENHFNSIELVVGKNEGELLVNQLDNPDYIKKINKTINKSCLTVSCLAYYHNVLNNTHNIVSEIMTIKEIISTAPLLNCHTVSLFIGRDQTKSIEENFQLMEIVFKPLVEFAESINVAIIVENCPMPSWHPNGYPSTIAYSPEFWREMFRIIPNNNFGLNFDPSHLAWQQIDYISAFEKFPNRIFSIHAKDIWIDKNSVKEYGIFGKQIERMHPLDFGWYAPKPVGEGIIEWDRLIKTASDNHYQGDINIEYKDKSLTRTLEALKKSKTYLDKIIEGID